MVTQAIVFDFDGVLAESEPLHLRVYQDLLEPQGIHLDQATYCAKYLGFDDEGVFRQIALDYSLLLGDEEIEMLIAEKARRLEKPVSCGDVPYPAAAPPGVPLRLVPPLRHPRGSPRGRIPRCAAAPRATASRRASCYS